METHTQTIYIYKFIVEHKIYIGSSKCREEKEEWKKREHPQGKTTHANGGTSDHNAQHADTGAKIPVGISRTFLYFSSSSQVLSQLFEQS